MSSALGRRSADLLEGYKRAFLIRHVDEEIADRYHPDGDHSVGPMRTPTHLSIGQECVAVGVAMACPPGTHVWLTHRTHGPYLAFGGDLDAMIGELFGKAAGCAGGWGGSMHLYDHQAGVMGGSAIVGSSVSLAVGSAFAAKMEGSDRLTVAWCGDAVPETGQFWEALNFAILRDLRLLFVFEDNGLSTATPLKARRGLDMAMLRYNNRVVYAVDDSFDGVYSHTVKLLNAGEDESRSLPQILYVETTRACAHVGPYVDYDALTKHDPVADLALKFSRSIADSTSGAQSLAQVEAQIRERVALAFERAEVAEWPA